MNNDLNDIPPGGSKADADRKNLLSGLNDEINFEEDSFENDAAEGLQQIPTKNAEHLINELNLDLHRHIGKKKKKKTGLPDQSMVYITIITILLLIAVAYMIIRKAL